MPKASYTARVDASLETLWRLLLEKIERPQRFVPGVSEVEILEREAGFLVRRMKAGDLELVERITVFERQKQIDFVLVDHPVYAGQVINKVEVLHEGLPLSLTFSLDWRRKDGQPDREDMSDAIRKAVEETKALAEAAE